MGFQIDNARRSSSTLLMKTCARCKENQSVSNFIPTKSWFYPDGYLPVCADCIKNHLAANNFNWVVVEKVCQYSDIPFVPREFERLRELNGDDVFPTYAAVFLEKEFEGLGWGDYFRKFKELKEQKLIEDELPELDDEKYKNLRDKWGANYDNSELDYLEELLTGIFSTQNVNGKLQADQAQKLCKISLEIDSRIRGGGEIDKMLTSYDKLVKIAEFTPKNVKNASDFDSVGELVRWLEKRGWVNGFYNDVPSDIVDETIKNIQSYNQRLYTNESGIGDEITRRIEALKEAKELEVGDDLDDEFTRIDSDDYENEGYNEFFERYEHDEVFDAEVEE